MRTIYRRMLAVAILALVVVLSVACGPRTATPGSESVVAATQPKTPKPTFTPPPTRTGAGATAPAPATARPSKTASPARTATQARTATPTQRQPSPTVTSEPPTATPTQRQPSPTATSELPTETPSPRPKKPLRMSSPEYGMQAFLWWRPEVASRDLQMIRDAGFTWCKVGFGWRDIEGAAKGVLDWSRTDRIVDQANDVGIDLVVRVDHQPAWAGGGFPSNGPPDNLQHYADFVAALAGRYRGRIRAYEVWNEPNLVREWGGKVPDPGAYVKMLRLAYAAIKTADPDAMVISGGLSPTGTWDDNYARPDDWYLESMYIAMGGSSKGYFDVLGAHGAGFKSPPERDPAVVAADPSLGGHRAFCFRRVEDLRAIMVKYGDSSKQIALLEFGWTSDPRPDTGYEWHAVTEQQKADYLVGAYQYAREHWSPWIGLMSLIYVADPDWTEADEQYWWAISRPSYPTFEPLPAYLALKAMPK